MLHKLCFITLVAAAVTLAPAAFAAKGKGHGHYHHGHNHHRVAKNYKYAPHGWHRHQYRPLGWYARGCVLVGPVWYCP
jgi:hypothetical protein